VCLNQLFFFIEMKTKIGSLHSAIKIHTYIRKGFEFNLFTQELCIYAAKNGKQCE